MHEPRSSGAPGWRAAKVLFAPALLASTLAVSSPAQAAPRAEVPLSDAAKTSLDGWINNADLVGDPKGMAVLNAPNGSFNGFPTKGDSALILSTGNAAVVADPAAGAKENRVDKDQVGTDLAGEGSADGNDLTQVRIEIGPPAGTTCVAFDFLFLSEEYPNYVGQDFNDIFTAEKDATEFDLNGKQVSSPNNFAYSEDDELLSVNTFTKFSKAEGSTLNGKSPVLSASAPLTTINGAQTIYLTVQDLGDSDLDSAVVIDNLRYASGTECKGGIESIVDTDGDALSDVWETKGIDYDGDGNPEVDLPAMGADPKHKDIFIELDWMFEDPTCATAGTVTACTSNPKDKTPDPKAVAAMVEAFAKAPVSNPDGEDGIDVHIDGGPTYPMDGDKKWGKLSKANAVPYDELLGTNQGWTYDWTEFDAIKKTNFETARADAFHYTVYANFYGDNDPMKGSSGISRGLPGGDLIVANHWGMSLQEEAGTLMHEFGHNLGLTHAADQKSEPGYQPGYVSIMNYCFQMPGLTGTSATGLISGLDFSRGAAGKVEVPCQQDRNQATVPKKTVDTVQYNDWDHLRFDGGSVGDLGVGVDDPETTEYPDALTEAEAERLQVLAAPGDGSASIIGPDLFAAGVDDQVLLVDVRNLSSVETTYRLELSDPFGGEPVEIKVPGNETKRVEVPIDASRTTDRPTAATLSLSKDDILLAQDTRDLSSIDLTDPTVAADAKKVLDQVTENPPEGFDPEVTAQLEKAVKPVLAGDVTPDIQKSSSGFPVWAIAAAIIAVVVLLVGGVLFTRRTKGTTT